MKTFIESEKLIIDGDAILRQTWAADEEEFVACATFPRVERAGCGTWRVSVEFCGQTLTATTHDEDEIDDVPEDALARLVYGQNKSFVGGTEGVIFVEDVDVGSRAVRAVGEIVQIRSGEMSAEERAAKRLPRGSCVVEIEARTDDSPLDLGAQIAAVAEKCGMKVEGCDRAGRFSTWRLAPVFSARDN